MGDIRRNSLETRYVNSRYGRIKRVDYENWIADIEWEQSNGGQPEVPLGIAFCTPRSMLGGMPEVGSTVLCDFTSDNAFNSKAVISNYIPAGYRAGMNLRQQIDGKREVPFIDTPQFRRKFRKLYPGEIIGSSTQGTDLLLDDNALLMDMKGDELRLDAKDQSINQISIQNYKINDASRHFEGWIYRAIDESFANTGEVAAQHYAPDTYQPYIYDEASKKRWYRTLRGDKTVDDYLVSRFNTDLGGFPDFTAAPLVEVRSEIREIGTGLLPLVDQNIEKDMWRDPFYTLNEDIYYSQNSEKPVKKLNFGNLIESVSGTLVGYIPEDITRYGKVLRPQVFSNPDTADINIQEISLPNYKNQSSDTSSTADSPGLKLIMQVEGFKNEAYPDLVEGWNLPNIGYGLTVYSNGKKVKKGDKITEEEAKKQLKFYLEQRIRPSLKYLPYYSEMSEAQIGALESFAYDVGVSFYNSPSYTAISECLLNKQWDKMRQAFMLYIEEETDAEAKKKIRRKMEADLWDSGASTTATVSSDTSTELETYAPDYTPVRYQAAAYMWKMPYDYSQTRLYVTKEGHTHLHVGATYQLENCPFDPPMEHPLGAGRSVEANFAGSIKAVIDKNLNREESLDLKTIGKVYFHFGKDDGIASNVRRNLSLDENTPITGITKPVLTAEEGKEATAKYLSIEGVTDGGISLRIGRTHGRNIREYEQNGFTSEGDKEDGLDVRDVNRAKYPSGDTYYRFHDLNRIALGAPGSIQTDPEDKRFGNPISDPNFMATSLDLHTVGSVFTRLGADSDNISYAFDTKGGLAGWLGADSTDNRSLSLTMDGGIEATIGRMNKSGNSIQAYLTGGIELRVRGNQKGQDIKIIAEGDQDMEFIGEQKIAVRGNLEYKTSVDMVQTVGANLSLNVSKNYLASIIGTRAVTIANTPPNSVADKTVIQGGNYEVEIATIGDMKMHTKAGELLFLTQKGDAALKAYINKVILEALTDSVLIKTPLTKVGLPLSLKYPVVTAATGCILTGGALPHLFGSPHMKVADNPPGTPMVYPPEI